MASWEDNIVAESKATTVEARALRSEARERIAKNSVEVAATVAKNRKRFLEYVALMCEVSARIKRS